MQNSAQSDLVEAKPSAQDAIGAIASRSGRIPALADVLSAAVQDTGSDLSEPERAYCELIVKGLDESSAYDQAFPARHKGRNRSRDRGRLAKNPRITQFCDALRLQAFDLAAVSIADLYRGLGRIAFCDLRRAFDATGNVLPPHQWPDDIAFALQGFSESDGPKGYSRKVVLPDRNQALKTLMEARGALKNAKQGAPAAHFHYHATPAKPGASLPKAKALGRVIDGSVVEAGYAQADGAAAFYRDAQGRNIEADQLQAGPIDIEQAEADEGDTW